MYCKKCGTIITDKAKQNCPTCNASLPKAEYQPTKFLPSFILGMLGALFGISGGLCMTMCTSLYSSGMSAFVLILGGSIVGLVGACKCLTDSVAGSKLELIGAVMIMICAYGITGADMSSIVAMLLFLIGGAIGLISNKINGSK